MESLAELKLDPEFRVIGEYLSQINCILRINILGIPDRILVRPVTQLFRSKWLNFFFQWLLIFYSWLSRFIHRPQCLLSKQPHALARSKALCLFLPAIFFLGDEDFFSHWSLIFCRRRKIFRKKTAVMGIYSSLNFCRKYPAEFILIGGIWKKWTDD